MNNYYEKIVESIAFLKSEIKEVPEVAIVLGTGLNNFEHQIEIIKRISYESIPHFPKTTVKGHTGELLFGRIANKYVIAQSGRFHYYEGYTMKEVTFPIRVFGLWGLEFLLMVSAVGGIHEEYLAGDVTVVNDHINLQHANPLTGPNDERLGTRFPDMVNAYDPKLIRLCHSIAISEGIQLYDSVYAGLPGPNIETKAEYQFLHNIGATVVGMSTVPEVIVAQHMGFKTCVLTAVTNKCFPISEIKKVTHDEVIQVASLAEQKISHILSELIQKI